MPKTVALWNLTYINKTQYVNRFGIRHRASQSTSTILERKLYVHNKNAKCNERNILLKMNSIPQHFNSRIFYE